MKKQTTELAKKIVSKFADVKQSEIDGNMFIVDIPQIGHTDTYFNTKKQKFVINSDGDTEERDVPAKTTKAQAADLAAAHVAQMIDSGELELSDTWAEQHLGDVKELTDETEKQ